MKTFVFLCSAFEVIKRFDFFLKQLYYHKKNILRPPQPTPHPQYQHLGSNGENSSINWVDNLFSHSKTSTNGTERVFHFHGSLTFICSTPVSFEWRDISDLNQTPINIPTLSDRPRSRNSSPRSRVRPHPFGCGPRLAIRPLHTESVANRACGRALFSWRRPSISSIKSWVIG
ncbi:hypothetical protein CDAR_89391 [Caerostris darwini]|uniref:Cytochrome c biogenesis B n=1 Tax=Caerostris darwini TaxID=1538125 RepID=A0AAV4NBG6_9ARAC|nr:hypothetical protein CDAR_89391 [Caerostris darwini]